jgi:hypothetical protein
MHDDVYCAVQTCENQPFHSLLIQKFQLTKGTALFFNRNSTDVGLSMRTFHGIPMSHQLCPRLGLSCVGLVFSLPAGVSEGAEIA